MVNRVKRESSHRASKGVNAKNGAIDELEMQKLVHCSMIGTGKSELACLP